MLPIFKSPCNSTIKSIQEITQVLQSKIKNAKSQYKNVQFHRQHIHIRQNQLNAKFLTRKKRLQSISKQNKNIYVKINTQKSLYCNKDLNRSYRSSSSISKRLSRFKVESREDSFTRDNSLGLQRRYNRINLIKPSKAFVYQTIDINKLNNINADNLKKLFFNEHQQKCRKINNKQNKNIIKLKLPPLRSKNSILSQRKIESSNIGKSIPTRKHSQLLKNQIKLLFFM